MKVPAKPPGAPLEWAPARLLESLADGISVQDLDMRIRYANRVLLEDFGHDIIGRYCHEAYEHRPDVCDGCPVKECLATGKPVYAQRVGVDKNGRPWFADIMATPLRNQEGQVVGAVETVRNVTERKLLEQEADRRNRETAALAEIATALNSHVELDDILDVALRRSIEVCGAAGGLIRLFDRESGLLVTRAWHAITGQPIPAEILPPQTLTQGVVGEAVRTSEIVIVPDLSLAPEVTGSDHGQGLLELGLNSIVIVPLLNKDVTVGTMALGSFERHKFGQVDTGLLRAIASQISVSIENARLLQAVRADSEDVKAYSLGLEQVVKDKADELVESELRFKALVENSNTAILAYDRQGRITEANRAAQVLLGCGLGDLIGKFPGKIECCPQFVHVLPQVFEGRALTGFEHAVVTATGEEKSVVSNAAPIHSADGRVIGAITTMVDVTARKRLEEQVWREKESFEHILNSLPVGVHIYDHQGRFVYANESFLAMADRRDYFGQTVDEIFNARPTRMTKRIRDNIKKSLGGQTITEDYFHPLANLWLNVGYLPVIREGRRHCLIITEDVSEKALLQEELKKYAKNLERLVGKQTARLRTSEQRYRQRNKELSALNSLARLVNKSLSIKPLLHRALQKVMTVMAAEAGLILTMDAGGRLSQGPAKNISARAAKNIADQLQNQKSEMIAELIVDPKRGPLVVAPLLFKDKTLGVIGLYARDKRSYSRQDMSLIQSLAAGISMALENARLYEEAAEKGRILARAYAELKELDALKSEFVSLVSHEFRTPLASIKGYLEVVKDGLLGPLTEVQQEKLAKADSHVDELTQLAADLLDLSAMETRKFKLVYKAAPVSEIIALAMSKLVYVAEERGQKLRATVKPLSLRIVCDKKSLSRLLTNLLENAVKFTPAGGKITIAAGVRNGQVVFKVKDNGMGIDKADLPRIFDRFFVAPGQTGHTGGGTGLGLAIVKGVAEAHGGRVWADSRPGRGAVFTVELPQDGRRQRAKRVGETGRTKKVEA